MIYRAVRFCPPHFHFRIIVLEFIVTDSIFSIKDVTVIHGRMEDNIGSFSFDHVFTDPPYLYLKHKLDKQFCESILFDTINRKLSDLGMVALFGRGTSFYRWNVKLADMGFQFKEEIIWNKNIPSGIMQAASRKNETISIHSKRGKINRVRVNYLKQKNHDYGVSEYRSKVYQY